MIWNETVDGADALINEIAINYSDLVVQFYKIWLSFIWCFFCIDNR